MPGYAISLSIPIGSTKEYEENREEINRIAREAALKELERIKSRNKG